LLSKLERLTFASGSWCAEMKTLATSWQAKQLQPFRRLDQANRSQRTLEAESRRPFSYFDCANSFT
jgi:hypothetical protein